MPAEPKTYVPWPDGTSGQQTVVTNPLSYDPYQGTGPQWGILEYASGLNHTLSNVTPGYQLADNGNVALQADDTVLFFGMTNPADNGLYVVGASGATRIVGADEASNFEPYKPLTIAQGAWKGRTFRYVGPVLSNMNEPKPFMAYPEPKSLS